MRIYSICVTISFGLILFVRSFKVCIHSFVADNETIDNFLHVVSSDSSLINTSFTTDHDGTKVSYQVSLHKVTVDHDGTICYIYNVNV